MPRVSRFKKFTTRLTNWEYWPFSVVYFPVFFYYAWLIARTRSFFFFTASNPSIDFGGMFGEKKSEIFNLIPKKYIPKTVLIEVKDANSAIKEAEKIGYPLIAKPDIGERGNWVEKIHNREELVRYASECPVNFLLQELISYPIELGVFFINHPKHGKKITSIVRKSFLEIEGNGASTILELLKGDQRAMLTADLESDFLNSNGHIVPDSGEKVLVEPIGNHCRGTMFLNDETEIDEPLTAAFSTIADQIPDFYFGRFDLRCRSFRELKQLKNFSILELNGAGAEPGHIYQPGYSLLKAYKSIFWHLKVLTEISIQNHSNGVPYWSFKEGYQRWKDHKKHNALLSKQ